MRLSTFTALRRDREQFWLSYKRGPNSVNFCLSVMCNVRKKGLRFFNFRCSKKKQFLKYDAYSNKYYLLFSSEYTVGDIKILFYIYLYL